jgi:hypothetical protein
VTSLEFLCLQSVVVDPALAMTLPKDVTVATGLTALYHGLEVFCNPSADDDTREVAAVGFARAVQSLQGFSAGADPPMSLEARVQAAEASLYASAALSRSTAGAARGLALAISGRYSMSYSRALACVAPRVLDASLDVMEETEDEQAAAAASARLCQLADVFDIARLSPPDLVAQVASVLASSQQCDTPSKLSSQIQSLIECVVVVGSLCLRAAWMKLVFLRACVQVESLCVCAYVRRCGLFPGRLCGTPRFGCVRLSCPTCGPPSQKIADTADVEENTASNMIKLSRRDLLDLLK